MAHHKRRRAQSRRAGCLHCKPHKHQRAKDSAESQTQQERRARISEREQRSWYPTRDATQEAPA